MKLLIKSVVILHPDGKTEKNQQDIFINNGTIDTIGVGLAADKDTEIFDAGGAYVSIGWLDMKANFRDPGDEVKEGIPSGLEAALAGGFTGVVLMSSAKPAVQSKADVEYIRNRANGHLVTLYPTGALSVNREGKDITEMFDMKQAGAVAFTDDKRAVADSGLMLRALQYAGNCDSLVIAYADDKNISGKGQVNEGLSGTVAGLKGIPAFSEELMVSRDLQICRYTGSRLHFSTLSTASAVNMVRDAKKEGLPVSAEVCAHQLFFDDSSIMDYDTNYKVKPPFRTHNDVAALIAGVNDGTIDVICSDHQPEDPESKIVEFDFAAFGISGIETAFAVANTASAGKIKLSRIIDAFTVRPRQLLGIPIPEIKQGAAATLTIFNPDLTWTPSANELKSKSKNNPFIGMQLKGRPVAVVANGQFRKCF